MAKIYTIGETVYDIIFKDNKPVDAKAGGSSLNASVSLGRLNVPVSFISELGNDQIGFIIDKFLNDNNVSTQLIYHYDDGQTAVAMAFLNEKKDAEYTFYKRYPKRRLEIELPNIEADDIVLFGSFFAIAKEVRTNLLALLEHARENGAIIMYDPNFRKAHLDELKYLKPLIEENISFADIVRASNEDLEIVFNATRGEAAYQVVKDLGCNNLIYTQNKEPVIVHTDHFNESLPVTAIQAVSTIGAGDNFNAGVVYSLYKNQLSKGQIGNLTPKQWNSIIKTGIDFSTHVCTHLDNYISKEFAQNYRK